MNGYAITFNDKRDVAEITFRDRFVAETIIPIIQELKALSTGVDRKGIVWDLRQADLSDLTMETLRDIFQMKNKVQPIRPLWIACVVSNPTDAHILRLWAEGFDDNKPYHRRWFFSTEEAHAWIAAQALTDTFDKAEAPAHAAG
jgi:hypothetical protein